MSESTLAALNIVLAKKVLTFADMNNLAGASLIIRKMTIGVAQKKLNEWQRRIKSNNPEDRYLIDINFAPYVGGGGSF